MFEIFDTMCQLEMAWIVISWFLNSKNSDIHNIFQLFSSIKLLYFYLGVKDLFLFEF